MPMFDDDKFPNRPRHEDMALLSRAVVENDTRSAIGQFEERVGELVDLESLSYLVTQRAQRFTGTNDHRAIAMVAGAMLDGFALGVEFERMKSPRT